MTYALTYVEIDVPTFVVSSNDETFRFTIPTAYLPGDIECIPSIDAVSFTPARISLGEDLGQRASLRITFRDHLHIFAGEPYDQGTFFGKWRGRYGTKLSGRPIRLIRGIVGQSIGEMDTRHYVVERTDGPTADGVYTIEAKDVLKFADEDRAQAPGVSNGSLAGTIDAVTGTIVLSPAGIGALEYDGLQYVCVGGSEVVEITNRVNDTLTVTRGMFGSVAQSHDAGDRVQKVLRYSGDDVADIIYDLLVNYAAVSSTYINLTEWQAETAEYLGVIYAATITEPTSVRKLLSELVEQTALALWWDDRAQKIKLNVLRTIATDTDVFDEERIIDGSLTVKEQPDKRISQIWTFYGQRDPTDRTAGEDNFRAALAEVDLDHETEYGGAKIKKVTARWIETETAATRLNSIQISRFRDPPRAFSFELISSESVIPVSGYQLRWWGSQDSSGNLVNVPIQVTQVSISSDTIRVEAEEMLASGVIVLVNVEFLLAGSGTWEVPQTWNNASNEIHTIAGGGGGHSSGSEDGGRGGGGAAYSGSTNVTLNFSPTTLLPYTTGAGGIADTNGGDTSFGALTVAASIVGAKGGQAGTSRTGGGAGGAAASGVGDVRYSGGNSGSGGKEEGHRAGGGGGGAAAGPHGNGGNGGSVGSNEYSGGGGGGADGGESVQGDAQGNGGQDGADNRFNFGGGTSSHPSGTEGGGGRGAPGDTPGAPGGTGEQLWTQTIAPIISAGPGGGGGGGGASFGMGGPGGDYGGGAGGSAGNGPGGIGGDGIIVLKWTET